MFDALQALPPDPILALTPAYRADPNPNKIDLGAGVYKNESGDTPVMRAVKKAEQILLAEQDSKAYVGPGGAAGFNEAIAALAFGAALKQSLGGRRVTLQTPGGCGGLRLAAEFIAQANPGATVWVSDPTWPNHRPLLGAAGLEIAAYPYYDFTAHSINFDAMRASLSAAKAGDVVLLHGCCHNPCGADPGREQWREIRDLALDRGFNILIDMAYQGLGDGLEEDVYGVRLLAESLPELMLVSSCSKNFGLYRERTGALSVICASAAVARAAMSRLAAIARANYSMPPDHGAAIVQTIMEDAELRADWELELAEVRDRINGLRADFARALAAAGVGRDFSFIEREKGMFSFLGVTPEQAESLVGDYGIYLVKSGRINIAGINRANIGYLVDSLAALLRDSTRSGV